MLHFGLVGVFIDAYHGGVRVILRVCGCPFSAMRKAPVGSQTQPAPRVPKRMWAGHDYGTSSPVPFHHQGIVVNVNGRVVLAMDGVIPGPC